MSRVRLHAAFSLRRFCVDSEMNRYSLTSIAFLLSAFACSTNPKQTDEKTDSLPGTLSIMDTTYTVTISNEDETTDSSSNEESFRFSVDACLDSMMALRKAASIYAISTSYDGYESGANTTYYFDSAMSLTWCEIDWSMEGQEGNSTYYFVNDEMEGGRNYEADGDSEQTEIYCANLQPSYGYSRKLIAGENERYETIDGAGFISQRSSVRDDFNRMIGILIERKNEFELSEKDAILNSENESTEYGTEVTTRENYTMNIEVFRRLISEE